MIFVLVQLNLTKLDDPKLQPGCKARNYHQMLEYLLQELIAMHSDPSILDNFPLRIGNQVKLVNLRIPVAFIISDTQGADKLCGRYISYIDTVKRLHHTCTCPPMHATNTEESCTWVRMDEMMDVINRAQKEELNSYSQNFIPSHAFRNIDFGANPHGIYGATPNDILHGLKLGIIPYLLEIFYEDELNASAKFKFNLALRELLPHLKQSGNNQFPRLYFPNGISQLANTTAEERVGILFATYILCVTSNGHAALNDNEVMSIARINQFVNVFEKLLLFLAWTSRKDGYWSLSDGREYRRATKAIGSLVKLICNNFPRPHGQGWNVSKMHELLHITRFIDLFGCNLTLSAGLTEHG